MLVGRIVDGRLCDHDAFRSLPPASVSRLSVGQTRRPRPHRNGISRIGRGPHQPPRRTGPGGNDW